MDTQYFNTSAVKVIRSIDGRIVKLVERSQGTSLPEDILHDEEKYPFEDNFATYSGAFDNIDYGEQSKEFSQDRHLVDING